MTPRRKMCLHHVYEDIECGACDRLIASEKVTKRLLYSQQRVWQLEQKADGRCEICGNRKGKCPSDARCGACLNRDAERKRKRTGSKRRWMPGDQGRPRYIVNAEANFKSMGEARMRRNSVRLRQESRLLDAAQNVRSPKSKGELTQQ